MKEILRNTLAAMAGALTGIMLIMLAELFTSRLYPVPAGVPPRDKAAMAEFIRTLPPTALLLILVGYFAGVFGGAWIAGRLSVTQARRQALMVVALFLFASLMNLFSFPHPAWFWAANLATVIGAGWLALKRLPPASPAG